MKKALSPLLAFVLSLTILAGCVREADEGPRTTEYTAGQLAAALIASQSEPPEFYSVTDADSVFSAYAVLYLGAELARNVTSGAICYPVGPLASEVAVFEFAASEDAKKAPEPMAAYIDNRVAAFYGYAPEESELAQSGQVRVLGNFAVLWILAESDAADAALESAFSAKAPEPPDLSDYAAPLHELEESDDPEEDPAGSPDGPGDPDTPDGSGEPVKPDVPDVPDVPDIPDTPDTPDGPAGTDVPDDSGGSNISTPEGPADDPDVPPEHAEPDEYDHDKVLSALKGETDPGTLLPKNRAVHDAVAAILEEIVTPDMTDYEKELAVNDYLVFHAEYDPAELTAGPIGTPDPDNDNPYGLLVKGVGVCLGYATTFQLIMDALDIECLTVHGYAHSWEEDHAWNLVRLDGDWYAVDVTWDDPVFTGWTPTAQQRLAYARSYFNVTSQYLRDTDHQWDEDVPEAEGTRWAYK